MGTVNKRMRNNRVLSAVSIGMVLVLMWQVGFAGPLRDRIDDRRFTPKQSGRIEGDIRVVRDIPYGSDPRQRFDVYSPRHAHNAPVIFMVHGGAWRTGDKGAKAVVDNKVARWVTKGFVLISTNYRLLPQADPRLQAEDVARALAVAQKRAASWGGDRNKFVLMGHSAGAHLVSLLATSPQISSGIVSRSWLGIVSLDSAALDVVEIMEGRHARLYDQAFGRDPEYWRSVSPFHAVTPETRPILLVCSTRRDDSCHQADRFAAKASSLGVKAVTLKKDLSHGDINQLLGEDKRYTMEVESFMARLDKSVARLLAGSR